MRIAALDLGSNSFHLLVADVHPDGTFETVTREKEVLRLGDDVTRHGVITAPAADRAVATVRRLKGLADAAGAREVIAMATSAIRSAANGSEIADRIEAETGVEVEVISGYDEARLIFGAVRASVVIDPGPAVCFDLGGGSVEIMVGDRTGLLWATSEKLGVGRLTASFLETDPPSKHELTRLEEHLRRALEPAAARVTAFAPKMAIGSSGTLSDLVACVVAERSGEPPRARNQLTAHRRDLEALHDRLVAMPAGERRKLPGLEPSRAELIVAGSAFASVVMEVFGLDELTISDWALREGMVLDAVGHHDPDDWSDDPRALRRGSVAGLARRCHDDPTHSRQVARLARSLFDQTTELHGLGADDRELLEYAALLHDIGRHVSRKGHHRHAAYLVQHGGLRGFAPEEIQFLAAIVRHHRRGDPKPSEPLLGALPAADRERVRRLAALLRVADGLDRGRRGVVEAIGAHVGRNLVILRLQTKGDPELELWGGRRKRALFEQVFERELEFSVVGAPPRELDAAGA